eukprot:3731721-Pleurochrysis_carterae.AAC.4
MLVKASDSSNWRPQESVSANIGVQSPAGVLKNVAQDDSRRLAVVVALADERLEHLHKRRSKTARRCSAKAHAQPQKHTGSGLGQRREITCRW